MQPYYILGALGGTNWRAARQSQQPSLSCLCTFREEVPLASHSSSHLCNLLVTLIDQTNFASAHLFKGLLQKFTTGPSNLGERQGPTVLNCKSNPFIHALECLKLRHSECGFTHSSHRFPAFKYNVIQLLLNTHNYLQRTCISMATSSSCFAVELDIPAVRLAIIPSPRC